MKWDVVYEAAIRKDGSMLFPQRLTAEFLNQQKLTLGTRLFNQNYQNVVLGEEDRVFRREWFKYTTEVPAGSINFGFIDPAISQEPGADYTGQVVVSIDYEGNWYVRYARRERLNPTQLVDKMFALCNQFNLQVLGIETIAFAQAILYILDSESRKRGVVLPVKDISQREVSKNTRISGLVPRIEWGRVYFCGKMPELEEELELFPLSSHDDLTDSLASINEIAYLPTKEKHEDKRPSPTNGSEYESWIRRQLGGGKSLDDLREERDDFGFS